jgi:hypothetical protein
MQFTPVTALVGGLTLGIAAVGKFAITGRVLGISGALKGFVQNHITPWRVWFTAGLVGGALVAKSITPAAFDILPSTFTVSTAPSAAAHKSVLLVIWRLACSAYANATHT